MFKLKNIVMSVGLGVLSLSLVLGAGYYKGSLHENGALNLSLPQQNTAKVKPVTVDLSGQGFFKKVFQPGLIQVSTHGIVNNGKKDYTLQFELTDDSLPVKWNVKDAAWDEENNVLARPLKPGEKIGVEVLFDVPKELQSNPSIYKAELKVPDYNTKEQLGNVPINIVNSKMKNNSNNDSSGKDCCGN
ncbi:hypothetical protein [Desulfitobacterium sp.]|uniref:hypothetical protein n=1 Tax=Desulfitobacterium sp. TaxID=49981 RepID=UPI002B22097B|nr:hypothetical protein [Desulfitobacterium sp.]MEA4902213.1 hypothetical protein [Desulfitobacterium sp.]